MPIRRAIREPIDVALARSSPSFFRSKFIVFGPFFRISLKSGALH
jgi:hypothetical protein